MTIISCIFVRFSSKSLKCPKQTIDWNWSFNYKGGGGEGGKEIKVDFIEINSFIQWHMERERFKKKNPCRLLPPKKANCKTRTLIIPQLLRSLVINCFWIHQKIGWKRKKKKSWNMCPWNLSQKKTY